MEQKAQGAIEYLLIIGAAILVVAIVVVALSGIVTSGTKASDTNTISGTYDSLNCQKDINALGAGTGIAGYPDCNTTMGSLKACKCCVKFPTLTTCKP